MILRILAHVASLLFGIVSVTVLHLVHASFFQYPMSLLHVVFFSLLLLQFVFEPTLLLPLGIALFFVIDLYSVLTPFGIVLTAGTIALLGSIWLYQDFFTNKSWIAAGVVTAITIVFFRLLYAGMMFILSLVEQTYAISLSRLLLPTLWEAALTSIAVAISVLALTIFLPQLQRRHATHAHRWIETS